MALQRRNKVTISWLPAGILAVTYMYVRHARRSPLVRVGKQNYARCYAHHRIYCHGYQCPCQPACNSSSPLLWCPHRRDRQRHCSHLGSSPDNGSVWMASSLSAVCLAAPRATTPLAIGPRLQSLDHHTPHTDRSARAGRSPGNGARRSLSPEAALRCTAAHSLTRVSI